MLTFEEQFKVQMDTRKPLVTEENKDEIGEGPKGESAKAKGKPSAKE